MEVQPVVRYMILCEDWQADPKNPRRVNILGLLSNIYSLEQPAFPLLYRELCVFLALTEGRGEGIAQIVCVEECTDQKIFETNPRAVNLGSDPLDVIGVPFRIRNCQFPRSGMYSIQFWYNNRRVEDRPLRLR